MKISIISPPFIPVPPPMYGGTELVVYNIIMALHPRGHDIILFAPKDSKIPCRLVPYIESETYFGLDSALDTKSLVGELSEKYAFAYSEKEKVDVIHNQALTVYETDIPTVHTLHGPATDITTARCALLSKEYGRKFIFISERQKELYLNLNKDIDVLGVIHNSVDVASIKYTAEKEDFCLFMGRANWEKAPDLAVRVAARAGTDIVMAIKMSEDFEKVFFKEKVKPVIDSYPAGYKVTLHEEITPDIKFDLYRRARCTLFTSEWEEPFGLVMIESMASGTPVIALKRGAAPEVIIDGKTGFLVDDEDGMVEALRKIDTIDPAACRKHVEDSFDIKNMGDKYISLYEKARG
ncbi:MAG: glycosyltransferase family 4 protein [Elusimicrobia bacterium]|nr:glycosyltransferase family 4 protein [Elusimicrobiota bacterium]